MKLRFSYPQTYAIAALTFACAALSSCGEPTFKVKGDIEGADKQSLVIEKSDFYGRWMPIDSVKTSSSGSFSIKMHAPAAPEIYRLALGDRYIYFPVDSVETVTVKSTAASFGSSYELEGSDKARLMHDFDMEVVNLPVDITPDSLASFKKSVFTKYLKDAQGSVVSYYVLTKTIGDRPLFDPSADGDYKYFAAVATGFESVRPNDPRAALLKKTANDAMKARRAAKGVYYELEADEVKIIDIELPDENGNMKKLSDIAGHGKPVVLMFGLLTHPESPALNLELTNLASARGFDMYQVSLDPDQYGWRDAARNLPWTTVHDADGEYSANARRYNVSNLPTYFIYSPNGELKDRAANLNELKKKL